MFLAGQPVPDACVLELARRLKAAQFDELADRLEAAWCREVKVFALEVDDREAILRVLEDGSDGFGELRAVLLQGARMEAARRVVTSLDGRERDVGRWQLRVRPLGDSLREH